MANRDRSQGFGFVYMDLKNLLSKMSDWTEDGPVPTFDAKVVNFNKDSAFPAPAVQKPVVTAAAPAAASEQRPASERTPVEQVRENLDRLQTLHHRIHVMLEELNQLGGRKKNPKGEN